MYKIGAKIDNILHLAKEITSLESFLIHNLLFHFHPCYLDLTKFSVLFNHNATIAGGNL